jgi:hypothetical protein
MRAKQITVGLGLAAAVIAMALLTIGLADSELFSSERPEPATSLGAPSPADHPARPAASRIERRNQVGFPAARDTGVPSGTKLRLVPSQISSGPGWDYDPRGWVKVYGKGAVLNDLNIPYNVSVTASDVTIKNVLVTVGGANAIGIELRHSRKVTIEDSTIRGLNTARGRMMTGIKDIYGDSTGLRVLYDNISKFETGIQLETGLVEGNYIHEPGFIAGDHTNGVMSNGGVTGLLTINHNTILINRGQTDAIGLFEDNGVQQNRRITDNLLAGGSYAIYGGQKQGGQPTSNIVITGNQISTMYYRHGGHYGCAAHFYNQGRRNIWSHNTWDATSVPSYSTCD